MSRRGATCCARTTIALTLPQITPSYHLPNTGQRAGEYDLMQPEQVAALITRFLSYTEPNIADFDQAVERFKGDTAPLAEGLKKLIADAHQTNKAFQTAFAAFFELCKTALNPNISRDDVDYIMETFPVVKRKDVASHGSYRTKDTILNIYDQMSALPFMSVPAPKDESATYPVPDVSQWQTWLSPGPASSDVAHPSG